MKGIRSPGTARRAPGRGAWSLERTRRGSCQDGTRSAEVSGGKEGQRQSIVWQTWSPGVIGELASALLGSRFLGKYFNLELIHSISEKSLLTRPFN